MKVVHHPSSVSIAWVRDVRASGGAGPLQLSALALGDFPAGRLVFAGGLYSVVASAEAAEVGFFGCAVGVSGGVVDVGAAGGLGAAGKAAGAVPGADEVGERRRWSVVVSADAGDDAGGVGMQGLPDGIGGDVTGGSRGDRSVPDQLRRCIVAPDNRGVGHDQLHQRSTRWSGIAVDDVGERVGAALVHTPTILTAD